MAWIILCGIDRTGKSSVSELYKSKGYIVHHMSAPDKKYREPGYSGPSYADDILDLIMSFDGKDVVFDRSWYGELVWSHVYGRPPQLTEDDMEVFREFEDRNSVERILMTDPDVQAHWKRCVDNKEPMNHNQFKIATSLFTKLAHKYNFIPRTLKDYPDATKKEDTKQAGTTSKQVDAQSLGQNKDATASNSIQSAVSVFNSEVNIASKVDSEASLLRSIEKANTIRDILDRKIFKSKGGATDELEQEVRGFLQDKLKSIFNQSDEVTSFSLKEVQLLKMLCKKLEDKDNSANRRQYDKETWFDSWRSF